MSYSDCHAHLELFSPEKRRQMINEARNQGINLVIAPSINLTSSHRTLNLTPNFDIVKPAVGLHPWLVGQNTEKKKKKILSLAENEEVMAISEVGLDFKHNSEFKQEQIDFFTRCLEVGEKSGKPLIIHLLGAFQEAVEIINSFSGIRGVVHCFGGSLENARELIDLGFLPSISNAVLTDSYPSLNKVIDNLDIEEMVIDTDTLPGTFQIHHAVDIANFIASRKNLDSKKVGEATTNNLKSLLSDLD